MKKYIAPAVELTLTETVEMMALSLKNATADDSEVLTKEQKDWDIWSDDAEAEQ